MKKLLALLTGWFLIGIIHAQTGFHYKILLSDNGQILSNTDVTLRLSILDVNNQPVYVETHNVHTDAHGLARAIIGRGTVVNGNFQTLTWDQPFYLKTEVSTDGGNSFTDFGTVSFEYVPYAKYAESGGSVKRLADLEDVSVFYSSLFVGQESGVSNASTYNTALGYGAMYANSSGRNNTAIGSYSMYANTTGYHNVAVGAKTLYGNTGGRLNVAVGSEALYANTSGSYNTVVGSYALHNNSTGSSNTVVGNLSAANTTGSDNVSVGVKALYYNNSGFQNTAIGKEALYHNTTGYCNTAIGMKAFVNGEGYNNSTAIGYFSSITASNQVRIGNQEVTSIGGYAAWTNLSDGRFKIDVAENVPGMALVEKLRPVTYRLDMEALAKWHHMPDSMRHKEAEAAKGAELQIGFIAQEVEQAARELHFDFHAVDKPKTEGDTYGLRYAEFVPVLVKALQEMKAAHVRLQQQVQRQAEKIHMLEEQNRRILQILDRQQ